MIVNNVGVGNIDSDRKINYEGSANGAFRITSADGQKLEGALDTMSYREVTAPGQAPWKVEIGIDSYSRTAVADGIDSQDTAFSAFFAFPAPPNGNHMFVSNVQSTDD